MLHQILHQYSVFEVRKWNNKKFGFGKNYVFAYSDKIKCMAYSLQVLTVTML